jgi:hypothetical protein
MRTRFSLLAPLAAVALCTAAARPVAAQNAAVPDHIHFVERAAPPAPRTIVVYRFVTRDPLLPVQVTIADSAGRLVGTFRLPGERDARPMQVDILENDLVLQANTPSGVLTIVLYRQNDSETTGSFKGEWILGTRQGELSGRKTG